MTMSENSFHQFGSVSYHRRVSVVKQGYSSVGLIVDLKNCLSFYGLVGYGCRCRKDQQMIKGKMSSNITCI